MSRSPPFDQAHGLRRLFSDSLVRCVPVVSNPYVAFGGLMLERLCAGFAEHGVHTLVVDASERAAEAGEMALLDLGACVETLSAQVSYLPARNLPLRFVDASGSTEAFLRAVTDASPSSRVILVHAAPTDLCRLFARQARLPGERPVCPLLLADDRPDSVTHAYAAMKLLCLRAGLKVHDLLLGAAAQSPRAERIAVQLAVCAEEFIGAVLRDWVRVDPATDASEPVTPALRRWVRECLARAPDDGDSFEPRPPATVPAAENGTRFAAANRAFH